MAILLIATTQAMTDYPVRPHLIDPVGHTGCHLSQVQFDSQNPFSALTLLVGDRKDILPGRCGQEQIETTALSIIL